MPNDMTHRRGFLGRMAAAAAAVSLPWISPDAATAAQQGGHEDWLNEVKGSHKCLFDFPNHKMGFPLVHIVNYVQTFAAAYDLAEGQVGTVGTFYSMGGASSLPMGFNDAMWAKYKLGEYMGLKDASGKAYTHNVFWRPTKNDSHLLEGAIQAPSVPPFQDLMVAAGIEHLQQTGTKFIMCNNALGGWSYELEGRGKGNATEIMAELRENVLPGVTIVPAMVIAIAMAQEAGLSYNKQ